MNDPFVEVLPTGRMFHNDVGSGDVMSPRVRRTDRPLLLLDFDGTLCVGHGPVLAYGEAAFVGLPDRDRCAATAALEDFLARADDPDSDIRSDDPPDGYVMVARLAQQLGRAALQAAYAASRARMAAEGLGVRASPGAHELLDETADVCERVLITNAPASGIAETLARIGVSDRLDQVVVGAGKPASLPELLAGLLGGTDRATMRRVYSVGDFWSNDLAVPHELGAFTAYVTAHPSDHPADALVRDLAGVRPHVQAWLDGLTPARTAPARTADARTTGAAGPLGAR